MGLTSVIAWCKSDGIKLGGCASLPPSEHKRDRSFTRPAEWDRTLQLAVSVPRIVMSALPTPQWAAGSSNIEVPQINEDDDLGDLVRKISLCVTRNSCSALLLDGDAARDGSVYLTVK